MEINFNQEEIQVLLYALRMYEACIKEENEELTRIVKDQEECGCCRGTSKGIEIPYRRDEIFCSRLRNKLKKTAMQFPCEEHPKYRKYDYNDKGGKGCNVYES